MRPKLTINLIDKASGQATFKGTIIKDGGGTVVEKGVVWGNAYNPVLEDNKITVSNSNETFDVTITDLDDVKSYFARAYAINEAGTAYGNCISFIARSTVGIRDKEINDIDFKVFPNPASKEINLEFDIREPQNVFAQITDLQGKIVFQKQLTEVQIGKNLAKLNISGLQNGLYICSINGGKGQLFSQKFFVTH